MSTKYESTTDSVLLVTGNHEGDIVISSINSNDNQIEPTLILRGGHKKTVRNVDIHDKSGDIFTSGEDCRLCCWNYTQELQTENVQQLKASHKNNGQKRGDSNYGHAERDSKLKAYIDKVEKKF